MNALHALASVRTARVAVIKHIWIAKESEHNQATRIKQGDTSHTITLITANDIHEIGSRFRSPSPNTIKSPKQKFSNFTYC